MHAPRTFALTAAALLATLGSARAEDPALVAAATVSRVTVYEDRALVERSARVSVPQGTSRIVFAKLPERFDGNSLRARSSEVRILNVDTERVQLAGAALPRVEESRKAWEAAQRGTAEADLAQDDAEADWQRLTSIRARATDAASDALAGAPADVATVERLLEFVTRASATARSRLLAARDAHAAAKSAEDLAKRRYEEVRAAAGTAETRVVLTVTADAAIDAAFAVQYIVPDATWAPVYDVRVAEDFGATNLELTAVVRQRTGEDWSNVPLELTTAQPSTGAAPPEPEPWIVDILRPREERETAWDAKPGFAAPGAPVPRAAPALAEGEKLKDMDEDAFQADVRRSGVVVAFRSIVPGNVPADGRPVRVALGRWPLRPEVRWTAFPKATDKVYVTAKMKNDTGAPLPGGEARVFVGPDYVGPMALADWGIGKDLDVGLGVDREVEVTREALVHERSTEGVFSKDTVHTRAFRVTLKNHRSRPIDVRLLDQVPVSQDEELKVEVKESSMPFAKLPEREAESNKARGVLEWRFGAAPGSTSDVRFRFEVRAPRDKPIVGMDD